MGNRSPGLSALRPGRQVQIVERGLEEQRQEGIRGREVADKAAAFMRAGDIRSAVAELSSLNPEIAQNLVQRIGQIDPGISEQLAQGSARGQTAGQLEAQRPLGESPRQMLDAKLSAEERNRKAALEGATDFETLSKTAQDQFKNIEGQFIKSTGEAQQQMAKISGLKSLADTAQESEQAASQLGAQVATMFESGRLTEEDVKRYTRRNAIPSRIEDLMLNWTTGTIGKAKAEDLKIALDAFQGVLTEQVNKEALNAAKKLNSRVNTGMSNEQIAKMLFPEFDSTILNPVKEELSVERFTSMTPDEQNKVLQGMDDAELEQFIQKLEAEQ